MSERERVIERIKKLMSFSTANASQGEVENAIRMANKLMSDLNIQEKDLKPSADKPCAFNMSLVMKRSGKLERMDIGVFESIHGIFNCVGWYQHTRELGKRGVAKFHTAWMAGHASDLDLTISMLNELRIWMRAEARRRYGKKWGTSHTSFCEGFANGLGNAQYNWRKEAAKSGMVDPTYRRDQTLEWLAKEKGIDFRPKPANPNSELDETIRKLLQKNKQRKTRSRKIDLEASNTGYTVGSKYDMGR